VKRYYRESQVTTALGFFVLQNVFLKGYKFHNWASLTFKML